MKTTPRPFQHVPRPPHVCEAPYHAQRRFGPVNEAGTTDAIKPKSKEKTFCEVKVMRYAETDNARLSIEIGLFTSACIDVRLRPNELRELAARLLDAAHDIEANPAAKLIAAMAAEECPA
jgi:hypothetical protein